MTRPVDRGGDASPAIDVAIHLGGLPTAMLGELGDVLARVVPASADVDAGGPRVVNGSLAGDQLQMELTADVVPATVRDALSVHRLDPGDGEGWIPVVVDRLTVSPAGRGRNARISVRVKPPPSAEVVVRVVLAGTGPTPLVGLVDGVPVPLAGVVGGPAGTVERGHDVVLVLRAT